MPILPSYAKYKSFVFIMARKCLNIKTNSGKSRRNQDMSPLTMNWLQHIKLNVKRNRCSADACFHFPKHGAFVLGNFVTYELVVMPYKALKTRPQMLAEQPTVEMLGWSLSLFLKYVIKLI